MKFREINVDMDGVLANFHDSALKAHGRTDINYRNWPTPGLELLGVLDLIDKPKSRFWKVINNTEHFWRDLEPFPWVEELIDLCRQHCTTRYGVRILTSPATSCNGVDKNCKPAWLAKHNVNCEYIFEKDKHIYSKPGVLLIDDWEKQVDPFAAKEGEAILFPQPWNRNYGYADNPVQYVRALLHNFTKG